MSQDKKDELKHIVTVVKALISSCKPPCLLSDILKDFIDVENKELPYRSLGYKSAQELLLDTGEFNFSPFDNGDTIVTAKSTKSTHSEEMILNQRNTNKSSRLARKPRRLHETKNPFGDQNNNNCQSHNRIIQNFQQRNTQNLKQQALLKAEGGQSREVRDLLNTKKKVQQIRGVKNEQNTMNDLRPILGAKNSAPISESNVTKKSDINQAESKKRPTRIRPEQCEELAQFIKREDVQNIQNKNVNDTKTREKSDCSIKNVSNTIQDKIKNELDNYKKQPQSPPPPQLQPQSQTEEPVSAIKQLLDYCASQGYSKPQYNIFMKKFPKPSYLCMVYINNSIYSTYPQEYETEYLAKEACSTRALELTKAQNVKKPLPVCSFSQTEFLNKLYTELLSYPYGIFAKNLPELFEDKFGQSLPEDWCSLVQASNNFLIESGVHNRVIIFANTNNKIEEVHLGQQKPSQQEEEIKSCGGAINNEKLLLPWSEDCWNIYITHCTSTIEIWGRLFGNNYNVRFELLMGEINAYMSKEKKCALSVKKKDFYLIHINECWHRVQVKELDTPKNKALCFFIDFGDLNWSPVNELYECKAEFLNVPAQAIQFSLHGLEDFEKNPYARKYLDELLPTKAVVGKILTKEKDFCNNAETNCKIQVVFFDTSTQEDINLNDRLLNTICNATPAPEIKDNTITNAIVTNICDNGDIYLQLQNAGLKYIQGIIEQTVKSKLEVEQHKVTYKDLMNCQYFLICDDYNKNNINWYRGKLIDKNMNQPCDDNFKLFYIDFGLKRRINMSKIFLLENLSVVLRRFPPQAIKVRLHNIPNVTSKTLALMRGFLQLNGDALVKLAVPGCVPLVKIYVRVNASGPLCTVNDAICIECELEGCSNNATGDMDPTRNVHVVKDMEESEKKSNILKELEDYKAIPDPGDNFCVRIALSASPSHFVVQPYDSYEPLQMLMKELQVYCGANNNVVPLKDIKVGQAYAVKNCDGFYHRATVVKKYGDITQVFYCDFGDTGAVTNDQLKILPNEFRHLPKMAVRAKLSGIKAIGDDWTLNDCVLFRKLTVGKTFVAIVKKIHEKTSQASPRIVELELIDVSTDIDVYIHEIFLTQERALRDC